jgi:adenylate cyclase
MVVFGLPILPSLVNPDQNAVQCAMDIMKEMDSLNAKRLENGQKERVAIGIGISSGEVIAGNVDSGDRVEYTVIGDAVNMVARIEDLAGDNQILMSPATFGRVRESVAANSWQPRYLAGFDQAVTVYELVSLIDIDAQSDNPPIAANQ